MTCGLASIDGAGSTGVVLVAGVGAAAGAGRAAVGIRRDYQKVLATQLTVTLARDLDMGVRVRLHRWRGSLKGDPTRVSIRYPLERAVEATLEAKVVAVCRLVLGAQLEVLRHDKHQGHILLGRVTADREIEKTEQQVTFERGCNIIRQMLGADAVVTPAYSGHQLTAFKITHKAGVRVANANRRAHIERVCTTMLPGRWRARWSLETDEVTLELRPTLPTSVPHRIEPITAENYWRLPYAIDEDGNVVFWDLASSSPHHMVCGRSGTGKTVEIRTLVTEAVRDGRNWRIWIVDPKRVEFLDMRDWPNIQIVATAIVAMVMVIYRAWQEMEDRYARIERREIDSDDLEPLIVVLDEYRDFVGMVNAWWQQVKNVGHPNRCPVFEWVSSIARKGRTARVHLVLGTQRPDAEWLGGETRDNFDSRTSLGPLSPQGAQMMWEASYIGVAVPRRVRGRATAMDDEGRPVEAQVMWTPEQRRAERSGNTADLELLAALRPSVAKHPQLVVELDESWLEEDRSDKNGRPRLLDAIKSGRLVEYDPDRPVRPLPGDDAGDLVSNHGSAGVDQIDSADAEAPVEIDLDSLYDEPQMVAADGIVEGDLIEVNGHWVAVEAAVEDQLDSGVIDIDWRSFDDRFGSLQMSAEEVVEIRRPFSDVDELLEEAHEYALT